MEEGAKGGALLWPTSAAKHALRDARLAHHEDVGKEVPLVLGPHAPRREDSDDRALGAAHMLVVGTTGARLHVDDELAHKCARRHEQLLKRRCAGDLGGEELDHLHLGLLRTHLLVHLRDRLLRDDEGLLKEVVERMPLGRVLERLLEEQRVYAHALHRTEEQRRQPDRVRELGAPEEGFEPWRGLARRGQHAGDVWIVGAVGRVRFEVGLQLDETVGDFVALLGDARARMRNVRRAALRR